MNMYHLFTARIGHLAMNTELFLRRQSRGMVEGELFRITDHFSGEKLANEQLYKMIQRRAVVHEVSLQEYQSLAAQGNKDCGMLYSGSNEFWEFNNIEPQLSFTDAELEQGQQLLDDMGIHKSPYVCIHDRSSHYLASKFPGNKGIVTSNAAESFNFSDFRIRDLAPLYAIENFMSTSLTKRIVT